MRWDNLEIGGTAPAARRGQTGPDATRPGPLALFGGPARRTAPRARPAQAGPGPVQLSLP
ncbi:MULTISPECIES: hypothetical protein [Streptomycetaceae]|uniref:Uncharacterized protein n=1 Tax=Streptantibioticus cattleyicolor (strain ATCC 35852 / DSM 46488 / JCM 4925 / NBRC 14057 / NRRL 8057) TaxID=1003195 RepID=F8JRR8_STREN|nr:MULTISPECIES: hypothetical protein [Streptomycetaceae]AEW97227.1 hypothetical protein SCATT_48560 [Streptantibioticus cattleyicolor NRRL 8057 = DSM 46488]MYS61682.1 hypothetical protein [Streptomyces sp. SID5468]CCB77550.1 protein of unknown function [Streptantibioticus cattleyicolor NRRL 8057 = DSM 46488]